MSWIHKQTIQTKSTRSASLTTTERIMSSLNKPKISSQSFSSIHSSKTSVESASASDASSTTSVESSSQKQISATPQTVAVQKLYLLLPNHKCPNKKTCPFHPPEEQEEELEEEEMTLVNKRRSMSLSSHDDRMISEQLLSEKLTKINQQISSNLLEGNKLHFPRKTSHDITMPTADLDRLRYFDHSNTPATSSTREESVASDYELDSGVTFDSCSDRELDEEALPLIQEEIVVPDIVLPAEYKLQSDELDKTISLEAEPSIEISSTQEVQSSSTVIMKEEEHQQVDHSKPFFVKELEYLTVTEGSLVKLECVVTGNPRPNIKWFKNDQRINSTDDFKMYYSEDGTAALIIEGAEIEDSGTYSCTADNVAGSATTQSKIRVQKATEEEPETEAYERPQDSEVTKRQLLVAPEFTAKLKNKTAEEGATVHLNCSVTGVPEPTCRWLKDGKEIFDGFDFTLRNNGGFLSLAIASASQALAGEYSVEASNSQGKISCSCIIQIEGDKEIEPLELDIVRPKFVCKIQDVHVMEGKDVAFFCIAAGNPLPEFKWHRDMINVTASDSVVIESNKKGHAQLRIKRVKPSDSGLYCCVAQSKSGRAKCSAYLHVTARSTSPESYESNSLIHVQARKESSVDRESNLGSAPSLVLMLPDTLDIVVGGKLKLDCSVMGYPMPLVTWHKGDRGLMYSQRHRIVPCGSLHTMEIPQVMALDKGEYIARATNVYGTVQSSCYVNILPKGSKVSAPDYTRQAVIVTAKENLEAPYFVKHLPKSIDALLGMSVRMDCIVREGIDLIRWSKSESRSRDVVKERTELVDEGFHGEFVAVEDQVREKSISHRKDKKEVVARKKSPDEVKIKLEPIYFTTILKDLIQPAGSEATFECSTSGVTDLEVRWYKNGNLLTANRRVQISTAGNKHTLSIIDVSSADEGVYTCKLNQVGAEEQSCRAVLTVTAEVSKRKPSKAQSPEQEQKSKTDKISQEKTINQEKAVTPEKYEIPSFKQQLPKAIAAKHGDNVEIVCELTSSDVTSVKWELNGTELPNDARYVVSSDKSSNQHKLTINTLTVQDSAQYTCAVYLNNGDSIHTSTKLNVSAPKPAVMQKDENQEKEKSKKYEVPSFKQLLPKAIAAKHGDNVEIVCELTSSDVTSVKWELNGKELPSDAHYFISSDESSNQYKLTINALTVQDSAKYTCVVYLKNGDNIHTSTMLNVSAPKPTVVQKKEDQEIEKPEKYEIPSFKQQLPKAIAAKHGDNVEIVCELTSSDVASVKWELNGTELPNDVRYVVSSDESSNQQKLKINAITIQDSAKYTCVVYLKNGDLIHTSTKLNVSAPKPTAIQKNEDFIPHFTTNLKDNVVKDGEELILECNIEGNPRPQILWFRDNLEVFDSPDFQISTIGSHCKLQVTEVYPEDAGNYSCKAVNSLGEAVSSCYVSVDDKTRSRRGETKGVQEEKKKNKEKIDIPPELVVKPRRQFIDEGGKAKFKSSFDGSKDTVLFWSRNGEVIKQSENILMYEADGFHFLEVLNVSAEDCGIYSVTVQNSVGSDIAEAELEVFEKPKLLTRIGPEWEKPLQNLTVEEGDTNVELVCACKELNQPSVKWFHKGKEIFSGFRTKIQHVAQSSTLIIKEIQERDLGEYKCIMTGKNGELETSCIMAFNESEIMEPPIFEKELHDMEVDEGDKLELEVEVKGTSHDRITWFHNNMEIMHDNPHYMLASLGKVHTLILLHATIQSSGEYVCEANNDTSSADTYCFVEVRGTFDLTFCVWLEVVCIGGLKKQLVECCFDILTLLCVS